MKVIYVNGNPKWVPESRIKHTDKWRKETMEEFRQKYGAWWIFSGLPSREKKTWIEKHYRKLGV